MTTAIKRHRPSRPARTLHGKGLILSPALDYGCGYGKDAEAYGMARYDPDFFPDMPGDQYRTILCTYVLNTLPLQEDCEQVIKHIKSLLTDDGLAYLTVRRDLGKLVGRTIYGYQHVVMLDLPIACQKAHQFTTYCMSKQSRVKVLHFAPHKKVSSHV